MTLLQAIPLAYFSTGLIFWAYTCYRAGIMSRLLVSREYPLLIRVSFFIGTLIGECVGLAASLLFWPVWAFMRGSK